MSIAMIIRSVGLLAAIFGLAALVDLQSDQAEKMKLGAISGQLYDQFGAFVVNAKVALTSSSTSANNKTIETFSNIRGEFKMYNVPPGIYDMRIDGGQGFAVFSASSINITNNKTVEFNVRLEYERSCDGEINNSGYVFTDEDRASLIRQVLDHVFVIRDWAGPVKLLDEEERLLLHTRNIQPSWVREHLPKGIFLLNDLNQYKKDGVEDTFHYLEFSEFEIKGSCVTIALINNLTGMPTLGTGAYIYEFRKNSSRWVGKCIGGWVS